ncbi:MAG TPA: iron-sulfur cluster assembly scaffold protein [Myxococcales bacterium]|jgi:nitrogen fixation NifU-like protein|nr:iron-sulfur cluster assembly scaffold protein [Myxococcales bacterium]
MSAPLYGGLIVEHAKNPRNRGSLPGADLAREGVNPLCGDRLRVELRLREGRVEAMRFTAEACMVSVAAASVLSEMVSGATAAEVLAAPDSWLLDALQTELRPARVGCALLPLLVLREALR